MVLNPANPVSNGAKGGRAGGIASGIAKRQKLAVAKVGGSTSGPSKPSKRVKREDSDIEDDDTDLFLTDFTEMASEVTPPEAYPRETYSLPFIIQTKKATVKFILTAKPLGKAMISHLKDALVRAIKSGVFQEEMFGTWVMENQAELCLNIGSAVVPSLLGLRHFLQPTTLNHKAMSKAACHQLLQGLRDNTDKLLAAYEKAGPYPNLPNLSAQLTTLPQSKEHPITQKMHTEQINALYEQNAGSAEVIRRELCEWRAIIHSSLHNVLQEKEGVIAMARYLVDNMDILDPNHNLPNATIEETTDETTEDQTKQDGNKYLIPPAATEPAQTKDVTSDTQLPVAVIRVVCTKLTGEAGHPCPCDKCDPEYETKLEALVHERIKRDTKAMRKEAYNQGATAGWNAGWTHAMKDIIDRYGHLDPAPVDDKVYQK